MLKPKFPIYLLSMEGDNPRTSPALRAVEEHFNVSAVLAKGLRGSDMRPEHHWPLASELMSPGQIACADGHLRIYLDLLASDRALALVVEDDVKFLAAAEVFWQVAVEVHSHYQGNWDVIHCGGRQYPGAVDGPELKAPGDEGYWASSSGVRAITAKLCGWNTGCYFISRRGAAGILKRATPLTAVIDAHTRYPGPSAVHLNTETDLYLQDQGIPSIIGQNYAVQSVD